MRPSKLTQLVVDAFNTVLNDRHNAIVCTDWELCFLMNDLLPEEARVSYRTFQRYKAEAMKGVHDHMAYKPDEISPHLTRAERDELETVPPKEQLPKEQLDLMGQLYKLWTHAIVKQKNNLMDKVIEANTGWQRFRWILERKFNDWKPDFEPPTADDILKHCKRFVYLLGDHQGITHVEMANGDKYYTKEFMAKYIARGKDIEELD